MAASKNRLTTLPRSTNSMMVARENLCSHPNFCGVGQVRCDLCVQDGIQTGCGRCVDCNRHSSDVCNRPSKVKCEHKFCGSGLGTCEEDCPESGCGCCFNCGTHHSQVDGTKDCPDCDEAPGQCICE